MNDTIMPLREEVGDFYVIFWSGRETLGLRRTLTHWQFTLAGKCARLDALRIQGDVSCTAYSEGNVTCADCWEYIGPYRTVFDKMPRDAPKVGDSLSVIRLGQQERHLTLRIPQSTDDLRDLLNHVWRAGRESHER
jgi:hypothetical protein